MRAALLVFMFITFLFSHSASAESVPFEICAESSTWMRPSPELQTIKIWNDTRYKRFGKDAYEWTHHFLVIEDFGHFHGIVALTNLAGLWTVKTKWVHQCYLDQERSSLGWIEVLLLLHRVKEIQHQDDTYTIVVEPSGKGFQWIFIRRINGFGVVRFVTSEGNELERWDESTPPEQFRQTVPPDMLRRVVRDR
jgi:hypothetical protein